MGAFEFSPEDRPYGELLKEALRYHRGGLVIHQYDPLWNPLQLSLTKDDCPTPGCPMTLPHLHSLIHCEER